MKIFVDADAYPVVRQIESIASFVYNSIVGRKGRKAPRTKHAGLFIGGGDVMLRKVEKSCSISAVRR